jgi:hypothetical protein
VISCGFLPGRNIILIYITLLDICRAQPKALDELRDAALWDIHDGVDVPKPTTPATAIHVQSLLRHAMSEAISEGIVNCLIVTDSTDTNIQLTRIHEHLFARKANIHYSPRMHVKHSLSGDPIVAGAWRRQTFSAAIDRPSPEMTTTILSEHIPALYKLLSSTSSGAGELSELIGTAYDFSRMLHGATSSAGDTFYRAYVPELQSALDPLQIELVKRCTRCEVGEPEQVGATVFLGLVKVASAQQLGGKALNTQTVMRRAMVICECALLGAIAPSY